MTSQLSVLAERQDKKKPNFILLQGLAKLLTVDLLAYPPVSTQ